MRQFIVFSILPALALQATVGHAEVGARRQVEHLKQLRDTLEVGPVRVLEVPIRMLDAQIKAYLSLLLISEKLFYRRKRQ